MMDWTPIAEPTRCGEVGLLGIEGGLHLAQARCSLPCRPLRAVACRRPAGATSERACAQSTTLFYGSNDSMAAMT
jgi:hypothetical protein